ncbi:MAG: peptidase S9 [Anaerolinea sp.]|nr:peptidase S9 [Anaerolinea sp.]
MTPDDLYGIKWVSETEISPDGRRVAFVVAQMDRKEDAYLSAIWLVDTDGGEPRQFTAGAKRDSAPRWSPDGMWLAFLSERGEEKPQLCVMPAFGGESRVLTKLPLGAGTPVWSPDGKRIAFSAKTGDPPNPDTKKAKPYRRITNLKYRLNGEGFTYDQRRHVFVIDASGGEPRQVTDGDWDDIHPAWSPDGREIAIVSARHDEREFDSNSDVFVVSAEGGHPRQVTDTKGGCATPVWSPDGTTIAYVNHPVWPSNGTLRLADAGGGSLRPVDPAFDRETGLATPAAWASPVFRPDGVILTVAQDRGIVAPIRANAGSPTEWLSKARRSLGWYSVSADGRFLALASSSVTVPAEVSLLDLESGKERQLTRLNEEWASGARLGGAEQFVVSTATDVEVDCWIMKPTGFQDGKQYPVLLNVHGGPFGQYGEGFFDEFQVYAGAGYGVVFCNPRGSSGQSTNFARALVGDLGGPDYHDVMTAFDAALQRMPWADQSRLGIMGGSYGGFMTTWAIGHSQRFKAAISERAVNDWYSMQGASDIGGTFNRQYLGEGATIQDDLELLLRQSPLTYAKDIETPVLILHSEVDLRCPISQAEQLFVVLKQRRRDVEFVRFPDEDHEMSRSGRPGHRKDRFEVILDYWQRKL